MYLCSIEASAEAMVYSYKHGFSGFAAKLTETQAQMISGTSTIRFICFEAPLIWGIHMILELENISTFIQVIIIAKVDHIV